MDDEVGLLAQKYLSYPGKEGFQSVSDAIAEATQREAWGDLSKWHRVRIRMARIRQIALLNGDLNGVM